MSASHMEKALLKLARQVNAFDEASLMDLWERFAERVRRFEPTQRWEESAIVFALIQGMRMKNQLFNYHLAQSRQPGSTHEVDLAALTAPEPEGGSKSEVADAKHKGGKLIPLIPRDE